MYITFKIKLLHKNSATAKQISLTFTPLYALQPRVTSLQVDWLSNTLTPLTIQLK